MKPILPDFTDEEEDYERAKEAEYIENCISGSAKLKALIDEAFAEYEKQHGLEPGEAQFLLLNTGVKK